MPFRILIHGQTVVDPQLNKSDLLWHYVDAAKLLDFLHNQRIYFCRGDQFQDKFEGQFTPSLKRAIENSCEKMKREQDIDHTYEQFRSKIRQQVFLSCWHQSDAESMAMWRIYGNSSCSVALTTTVGNFQTALDGQNFNYLLSIEKVEYVDYNADPDLDISPYSRVFAYKHDAYAYEQEVRIFLDLDRQGEAFDTPVQEKGVYVSVNPSDFLRNIVVSPNAPSWFRQLIVDLANKYQVPCIPSALAVDPI